MYLHTHMHACMHAQWRYSPADEHGGDDGQPAVEENWTSTWILVGQQHTHWNQEQQKDQDTAGPCYYRTYKHNEGEYHTNTPSTVNKTWFSKAKLFIQMFNVCSNHSGIIWSNLIQHVPIIVWSHLISTRYRCVGIASVNSLVDTHVFI